MANGNDLKLRVLFDMIDGATKPLRNIMAGNKGLAKSLKESRDELGRLKKAQQDVSAFREMHTGLSSTATELGAAQKRVKELAGALRAFGPPSQQMTTELANARKAASALRTEQKQQTSGLQTLRDRLSAAGIDTRNLSQHERELRASIASTTGVMTGQMQKLDQLAEREKRVGAARAKMNRLQGGAANMAVAGYAAKATGSHILGDLRETLDESKTFEVEAMKIKSLGLGDHATADAVKYAKAMKSYGTSTTDNVTLMRDSMTIFADEHHAQMVMPTLAKMKFASESMFGAEDGHANEEKFMNMLKVIELRGGTKDEATFKREANMVQKVITATGGRVGGDQWMQFIQTGGVAAKQMRNDAFYNQMEPLIQEMGGHAVGTGLMSAYSNVYQGKTTVRAAKQMMDLDLLDKKKVEYNKIGMIKQIKPGALAGGDLLKASPLEWMEKVLLPKLAKKGITDPDKVKDMIATIFTNRTAANLFTTMYMQRSQIHKNERLNAGADGIDEGFEKSKQLTQGREIDALAKLRDLKLEIGDKVSPIYNAGLALTADLVSTLTGFMREHSTVAKVVLVSLTALGALLAGGGMLTIALAGILGPLALVRFSMTTLGLQGGILARVLGAPMAALRMLGSAAMFVGRALLMNPIGLAVTAIAVSAFLIYKYWEPIKTFFSGLWGTVSQAFASGLAATGALIVQYWEPVKAFFSGMWEQVTQAFAGGIGSIGALIVNWSPLGLFYQAFAAVMQYFGFDMPAKFSEFGGNLISGLVNGITSGLGAVKDAITNVAGSTVSWFKEKLGIHSPSRVFGELGGFITEGAALGIEGEQARVSKAAAGIAALAVTSFGALGAHAANNPLALPALTIAQAAVNPLAQNAVKPLALPAVSVDTREAVTAPPRAAQSAGDLSAGVGAAAGAAATQAGAQYIFQITGADPKAIADEVRQVLAQIERQKQSRVTSRLTD